MTSHACSGRAHSARSCLLLASTVPVLRALWERARLAVERSSTAPAAANAVFEPLESRRLLSSVTSAEMYLWAAEQFAQNGGGASQDQNGGDTIAIADGDNGTPQAEGVSSDYYWSGYWYYCGQSPQQHDYNETSSPFCPSCLMGEAMGQALRSLENPGTTAKPIRYFNGQPVISSTDLASSSFGVSWGQTRSWSDASRSDSSNYAYQQAINGQGWAIREMPQLVRSVYVDRAAPPGAVETVVAVGDAVQQRYFDRMSSGGPLEVRGWHTDTLTQSNGEFVLTDGTGRTITFYDFTTAPSAAQYGQFKSLTDSAGNVTLATYAGAGDPDGVPQGRLKKVTRSNASGESEKWEYAYVATGVNAGLLRTVKLLHGSNATPDRQVEYTYWDGTTSGGNAHMLQKAEVRDGSGNTIDATFYRYFKETTPGTPGSYSDFSGYKDSLKMVFVSESYARIIAANIDPTTASDANLRPYADNFFGYHLATSSTDPYAGFVVREVAQGAGCSCAASGGQGDYALDYYDNPNVAGTNRDYNTWVRRTTVTLPDGNLEIAYTNFAGQVMLSVLEDTGTNQKWRTSYQYDSEGRLLVKAEPSAVTTHFESSPDLINDPSAPGGNAEAIADATGLVHTVEFGTSTTATASTAGDAVGYVKRESLKRGETGAAAAQRSYSYIARSGSSVTTYPIAQSTEYRYTGASGTQDTTYAYTWRGQTNQAASVTVTKPYVYGYDGGNGPNASEVSSTHFDQYGRAIWTVDGEGYLTFRRYDDATGAVVEMVQDADPSLVASPAVAAPTRSSSLPAALHLVTTMQNDGLGRTTKTIDPNGHVTYTVYDDDKLEVRTYPGWNAATKTTTGPVTVQREDRPGSYSESLTFSWSGPSGLPVDAGGRPTGAETLTSSYATIESLSRTHRNTGNQVDYIDAYFDLSGVAYSAVPTLGVEGTNFDRTRYGYDDRGRRAAVEDATGTVTHTVYDAPGRVVGTWVGTDDVPTSGEWSPTNAAGTDLVEMATYEYDHGTAGDGNLTKMVQHIGGLAPNDRVTLYDYDWRDRRVLTRSGVIYDANGAANALEHLYVTYDNLNQAIYTERFGEATTVGWNYSDGVPVPPSVARRSHQSWASYDNRGRAWQTGTSSVNPATGTTGGSLTNESWYDLRGNLVKQVSPGGLVTKYAYDGAGRQTAVFATDGGGDAVWADADDVAGDVVLEERHTDYDAAGNAIFSTAKLRFHDAAGTGPLGTATSGVKARASHAASYYDAANRLTASIDVGTNGGATYVRPSSVPARSDDVLVNGYAYDAAGRLSGSTDPRGIETRSAYDALGRRTSLVENYVDGIPSDADDRTTRWAYNGVGDVLTMTADLPGGQADQTTRYDYQARTARGDGLNANNVLTGTRYPMPADGPADGYGFHPAPEAGETAAIEMERWNGIPGYNIGDIPTNTEPDERLALEDFSVPQYAGDQYGLRVRGYLVAPDDGDYTFWVAGDDYGQLWLSPNADAADKQLVAHFDGYSPGWNDQAGQKSVPITLKAGQIYYVEALLKEHGGGDNLVVGWSRPGQSTAAPSEIVPGKYLRPFADARASQQETYAIDRSGRRTAWTDRNGTTHAYAYDALGRLTEDDATTLGAGVDGAVRTLTTAYDDAGRVSLLTSLDGSAGVVNQVARSYNGLGQLTEEKQENDGAVDAGTPIVGYAYSEMAGGANHSRLTGMAYPDQSASTVLLSYGYGTAGSLGDRISRLDAMSFRDAVNSSGKVVEAYDYLGLSTVVGRRHPQNDVDLLYYAQSPATLGDGGDQYTGLDRFGRVVDQRWADTSTTTWTDVDRSAYGYDRGGNRLYEENLVLPAQSELYSYDGLSRLTGFDRGTLNANKDAIAGTAARTQDWGLDALGNWNSVTSDNVAQTRSHDAQNRITGVASAASPAYSDNGEMTSDETGQTLAYDAWGRLVAVDPDPTTAGDEIAYRYDALSRRVYDNGADLYYSQQWQVLEERDSATGNVTTQNVWSPVYVDAMVLRDRNANGTFVDGLEERLYALQDANYNVTALADASGAVVERYRYDPYGTRTVLDADGTPDADGSSDVGFRYGHQGGRHDEAAGLVSFRNRDLDPSLGRWTRQDPAGYVDGGSLYTSFRESPLVWLDPNGQKCTGQTCSPGGDNVFGFRVTGVGSSTAGNSPERDKGPQRWIDASNDLEWFLDAMGVATAGVKGGFNGGLSGAVDEAIGTTIRDVLAEKIVGESLGALSGDTQGHLNQILDGIKDKMGYAIWIDYEWKSCEVCNSCADDAKGQQRWEEKTRTGRKQCTVGAAGVGTDPFDAGAIPGTYGGASGREFTLKALLTCVYEINRDIRR